MKKFHSEMLIAGAIAVITATSGITAAHASFQSEGLPSLQAGIVEPDTTERKTVVVKDNLIPEKAIVASADVKVSFERVKIPAPGPSKETLEAQRKAKEKAAAEARLKAAAEAAAEAKEKAEKEAKAKADKKAKEKAEAEAKAQEELQAQGIAAAQAPVATNNVAPNNGSQTNGTPAPVEQPRNIVSNPNAYQRYAGEELARRGMGGNQELSCLITLWERESNWNPNAANPTSTARGIPQKMMDVHHGPGWLTDPAALEYLSNPQVQINWGVDYIKGRYGTACSALDHSNRMNWY